MSRCRETIGAVRPFTSRRYRPASEAQHLRVPIPANGRDVDHRVFATMTMRVRVEDALFVRLVSNAVGVRMADAGLSGGREVRSVSERLERTMARECRPLDATQSEHWIAADVFSALTKLRRTMRLTRSSVAITITSPSR
jgi:hypothetical protein